MRNLHELFNEICEVLYELDIDPQDLVTEESDACQSAAAIRVCGAYQPNYPLAANISHLKALPHESNPDESVVWVALSSAPHDLNPYAPNDAWEDDPW